MHSSKIYPNRPQSQYTIDTEDNPTKKVHINHDLSFPHTPSKNKNDTRITWNPGCRTLVIYSDGEENKKYCSTRTKNVIYASTLSGTGWTLTHVHMDNQ